MRTVVFTALCLAAFLLPEPSASDFWTDCADFDTTPLHDVKVVLINGKKWAEIKAETALTEDEKLRGLMCRKKLPDGSGMLFPYEKHVTGGFWMFNTYIDLDILYIAEDGTVIKKVRMKKCPKKRGENRQKWETRCALQSRNYKPPAPYKAALELPAGYIERKGFDPARKIRAEWKLR